MACRGKRVRALIRGMNLRLLALSLLLFTSSGDSAAANPGLITPFAYLDQWGDEAVRQMVLHEIPACITLAQGMLESGNGNSKLAAESNNHFGIKCHSDWTGGRAYHDDDKKGECFRAYESAVRSFEDHSDFLGQSRYASLFELRLSDYKGWARGLKACGYATNPQYASKLIDLIERYDLTRFDKQGLSILKSDGVLDDFVSAPQTSVLPDAGQHAAAITGVELSANDIQFVIAQEDESFSDLAEKYGMMHWQFCRYNEVPRDHRPSAGEVVYLQPKRSRGATDWHTVEEGETLRGIAHAHGIKFRSLLRKNGLEPDALAKPGEELSLKWRLTEDGELPFYALGRK